MATLVSASSFGAITVSDAEKKRDLALFEKKVCEVAFAAILVVAAVSIGCGALAAPKAGFFLATLAPISLLLVSHFYKQAVLRIEQCQAELDFAKDVARCGSRWEALANRGVSTYLKASRLYGQAEERGRNARSSPRMQKESCLDMDQYADKIAYQAIPDLLQAACEKHNLDPILRGGRLEILPFNERTKFKVDSCFQLRNGSKLFFKDIEMAIDAWRILPSANAAGLLDAIADLIRQPPVSNQERGRKEEGGVLFSFKSPPPSRRAVWGRNSFRSPLCSPSGGSGSGSLRLRNGKPAINVDRLNPQGQGISSPRSEAGLEMSVPQGVLVTNVNKRHLTGPFSPPSGQGRPGLR